MNRNLVTAGLLLIAVSYGLARFAYGLYLPEIRAELELTPTLSGLIGSGSYFGYCVAILVSAFAVSRFGPRTVAVTAGMIALLGMVGIASSPSAPALAAAVLFAGMSTGLASPPMADAVSTTVPPERQSVANTIINSGTSAGIALSGPIALVAAGHWREAYAAFAVIAAVATVWIAFATPAANAVGRTAVGRAVRGTSVRKLFRREALPVMVAATGMGFASAACWLFGREVMLEVGGLDARTTSVAWIVLGIAGFAGAVAGSLVERFGIVPVHVVSLLALAGATLSLGMLPSSTPMVFVAVTLFGAAYIMLTGVYLVWGVRVYPDKPAFGLGLPFLMIAVGQVLGGPVAGLLIDLADYRAAFVALAATALLTGLIRPAAARYDHSGQPTVDTDPEAPIVVADTC